MPDTKIELHCAYVWDCDACGRENFCRAIIAELTEEDRREMRGQHGLDDDDLVTGNWMTRPDRVTCAHCGAEFDTTDPYPDGPAE